MPRRRPTRVLPRRLTIREIVEWRMYRARPGDRGDLAKLDAGRRLPKSGEFTVDASNAPAEARIIRHLLRERMEQCGR